MPVVNHTIMDDSTIKENITQEREKSGISQSRMADRLGMDRNTYHNLEKGGTRILNSHLGEIAKELGVSKERLLLGYEPIAPEHGSVLNDYIASSEERYGQMVVSYDEKIKTMEKELESLRELVESLKAQVRDKDMIISFLKRTNEDA